MADMRHAALCQATSALRTLAQLSEIEWRLEGGRSLAIQEVEPNPHMVTDVHALELANQELAEAVANMQRAIDQMQQQQALQIQALLNAARGQWDAARFGTQSVEAILVALNPALQGKVRTGPFDLGA